MSPTSGRNRRYGNPDAAKARGGMAPYQQGATFTGDQVVNLLAAAGAVRNRSQLLDRPPQWADSPFPPGTPLPPSPINQLRPNSGRPDPRLYEIPLSTNINLANAPFVPWAVLDRAAETPLFRKCIERRKGICDMDFAVVVDPRAVAREAAMAGQHEKDVESAMRDKYAADIVRISDYMAEPDRQNNQDWSSWGKALMENRLRYDAAVVSPKMTFGGDLLGLRVITGKTIKPLIDDEGARPATPAVAYQQLLYGFPRSEFTATVVEVTAPDGTRTKAVPGMSSDQMMYERTIYRPESPYGMSATEIALLDGILFMRRFQWIMTEYTHGVMPDGYLKVNAETEWDVTQWEIWATALNDMLTGNTAQRYQWPLMPPGIEPVQAATVPERYRPDYDMFLIKLVAGDFGLTATEIGFPEVGSLGASFHEGEEDVLNRVTRIPDANWLAGVATRACKRFLNMPAALKIQILGLESEDEAAADAIASDRVENARMTLNEDRARRGEPAYDFEEADMPMLISPRGIVFLEGASKAAPPGTLISPLAVQPGQPGDSAGPAPDGSSGGEPDPDDDDDDQADDDEPPTSRKVSKSAELVIVRRWLRSHPNPARPFACNAITAADAPDLASDPRVLLKASDAGPKAPARSGTGQAGTATASSSRSTPASSATR